MSAEYETALAYFRDHPNQVDVILGDARAAQEYAATIVRGLMADDVVTLTRAEWEDVKTIVDRWPLVRSELDRLRALQPPVDLPATLTSVDDVHRVCNAAELTWSETGWSDRHVIVSADGAPDRIWRVEVYRATTGDIFASLHPIATGAELCALIQAARSTS